MKTNNSKTSLQPCKQLNNTLISLSLHHRTSFSSVDQSQVSLLKPLEDVKPPRIAILNHLVRSRELQTGAQ